MALDAYLELHGSLQGHIKGSSTQIGREDLIIIHEVHHSIVSPRNMTSGLATGKRQHKPLVITKELDKSTPLLYDALVRNENINKFELQFWTPSASGQEVQHYTIELQNASIVEINFTMPNNKVPELMSRKEYEEIAFCYQKIIWTWQDGGITAEDDWMRRGIRMRK
jgi:type VI secretion system secreted protein Hcp